MKPRLFCLILSALSASLLLSDSASFELAATGRDHSLARPRIILNSPVQRSLRSLHLLSWNIDRGESLSTILPELQSQSADLLLLQEVDWNTNRTGRTDVVAELAHGLHLNAAYGVEFEELSQEASAPAYIGQATLTHLPIRRSRILNFTNQSGFWKPKSWLPSDLPLMQRRLGGRIALVTELEFAGRLLVVYNTHLESRSYGRIQWHQLQEILSDFQHQYPPQTACILGGDLNTKYWPSFFLKRLEEQGFHSATGNQIERSHTIAMALDWIFAKGPIELNAGRVDRSVRGSDHYPVIARLSAR